MTRIVRKPLNEDMVKFSAQFDSIKRQIPETTLSEFCKTYKIPYQALRAVRANMVRTKRGSIKYSRDKRSGEKIIKDHIDQHAFVLDEEPKIKRRKRREKHVDVFDELEKAYATIGRLVVNGGKL